MLGVSVIIKGSIVKNGWHQSVSGAVGAMWRHLRVASARSRQVVGAVGTYLHMSLSGCPDVANIVSAGVSSSPSFPCKQGARRIYVGFVSQENDAYEDAWPNIARGRAC
jgi:hypothetical protein